MTNQLTKSDNFTLSTLAVVTGKGLTASDKLDQHKKNGADPLALLDVGKYRKEILTQAKEQGFAKTAHALSVGNIRPAAAVIVALTNKSIDIVEIDGKAPYSEWLRLGASLQNKTQVTNAGKPTAWAKALSKWTEYTEAAKALRASREAAKTPQVEASSQAAEAPQAA